MKLRWIPHILNGVPVLSFANFPKPETDPLKIELWATVVYVPEMDSYGASYMSKGRVLLYASEPFDTIPEALTSIEQLLFEEGIREDG